MVKRKASQLRAVLASVVYFSVLYLISLLPLAAAYSAAELVGRFRFHWRGRWRPREIGLRAMYLELRFGTPSTEVGRQLKRFFERESCEDLEICLFPRMSQSTLSRHIAFEGFGNLTSALTRGTGVVLTSGHVRGMYLTLAALALQGFKITILKRQRIEVWYNPVERWFFSRRMDFLEKVGIQFLWNYPPDPFTLGRAAKAVHQNRIFFTPVDMVQPGHHQNVEVEFLHQTTMFPPGPALIAQATGSPLIDFWVNRGPTLVPAIARFGEPIYVSRQHVAAIQEQVSRFENDILADPATWNPWLFPVV